MFSRMKTTAEIADPLLERAKLLARQRGLTFREILDVALRRYLESEQEGELMPFRLRDTSVGGEGLAPEIEEGDWVTIRRLAYEGRGE